MDSPRAPGPAYHRQETADAIRDKHGLELDLKNHRIVLHLETLHSDDELFEDAETRVRGAFADLLGLYRNYLIRRGEFEHLKAMNFVARDASGRPRPRAHTPNQS